MSPPRPHWLGEEIPVTAADEALQPVTSVADPRDEPIDLRIQARAVARIPAPPSHATITCIPSAARAYIDISPSCVGCLPGSVPKPRSDARSSGKTGVVG